MLKKVLVGIAAGVISGLFAAGGRNDSCSSTNSHF